MTDNRTTELRAKLTERGVEWVAYEKELRLTLKDFYDTRWNAHGVRWSYLEINGVATLSPVGKVEIELTPEQAIAATLGSDASAVRLVERLRSIADEMRNMGASTMTWHELLAFYASDVDKVADSLMFAATLGSERHVYEQRITGDGSDWGEIMRDAYDDLMASACESCTPEQMGQLSDYIRAELVSGEPPYDELIRCLKNDWYIRASWDGLRKFWCIELTEEGVQMRDATHGTLTAEQVRELIAPHLHARPTFDFGHHGAVWMADFQAIADELNALLGSGTCKPVETETLENVTVHVMECDECGGTYEHVNGDYERCPHCRRKVER